MGRGPADLAEWMAEMSGGISVDRLLGQKGGVRAETTEKGRGRGERYRP